MLIRRIGISNAYTMVQLKNYQLEKKLDFFIQPVFIHRNHFLFSHTSPITNTTKNTMNATTSPLFIKSAKLAATCLSLVVFQLTSAHAQWDQEFLGSELVASPWAVQGSSATVDGNTTIVSGANLAIENGTEWNPGLDYTLEFEMAITEQGPTNGQSVWSFAGTNGNFQFLLNQGAVILNNSDFLYAGTGIDGSVTNTYRLVVDGAVGTLYINNTEVLSNIAALTSNTTLTPLWVGDFGAGIDGVGRWEAVRWNNTTAIPIPEPSTAALLFGVFAAGVALRRRRA